MEKKRFTTAEKLNISVEPISKGRVCISFYADEELGEKIIENLNRYCWLGKCKNCRKTFIVNSATHEICWRCRKKDKTAGPEEL